MDKRYKPSTPAALITGATSGIGRAFAFQLAQNGYHLLLVARGMARLEELSAALSAHYACTCECLPMDLSQPEAIQLLVEKIKSLPALDLLINNAGFGILGPHDQTDPKREADMINLHVLASQQCCQAALPGMMRQKKGGIINVASVAGLLLTPNHVNYNATKNYIIAFSRSLAEETRPYGIQIQALCPGYTRTAFHQQPDFADFPVNQVPSFLWMSAEKVAEKSLTALGKRKVVVIPGLWNQGITWVLMQPIVKQWMLPIYHWMTRKHPK